ncbi:MAG: hypothetical protein JOZ96_05810 [Acidobacteria bacterium]|nr:hypothetical protein [Acidobacteriota bacterium]
MRKFFSPLPPLFMLLLACAAAHAQPARQPQRPERSARCRRAATLYIHPSPDKKHLTVGQEDEYEYRGLKKYLRVCGDSDDEFTRRITQEVANHEAALRACGERRAELRKRLMGPGRRTEEGAQQDFEAARDFLRACRDEDEKFDLYLFEWVTKYEKAVREFEEKKRQNGEPPAKEPTKEQ